MTTARRRARPHKPQQASMWELAALQGTGDLPRTFYVLRGMDERDVDAPGRAGFIWSNQRKFWYTTDFDVAARLAAYANPACREMLKDLYVAAQRPPPPELATILNAGQSLLASRAQDADIVVPLPDGCELMPFQRAGIAYALRILDPNGSW